MLYNPIIMKNIFTIMSAVLFLALSSCSTVQVKSDYDHEVNFSKYQTIAFHKKGLADLKMNDLDKRRVVSAITNEFKQKGVNLIENENSADLLINLSAKKNTRVQIDVDPWYNPWWGFPPFWGRPNNVRQYKEGTIVIDLVDRSNNTLVWQGVGIGLNISDLESKAEKIPLAIKDILAKYPPKK